MAIIQVSKIQVRTGNIDELPQLSEGELGWASDSKRLFIGNDPNVLGPVPDNTEILTQFSQLPAAGTNTQIQFNQSNFFGASSSFTFDYGSNTLSLGGNFVPQANGIHDLGSASYQWGNLYLSGNSLYLGGHHLYITNDSFTTTNISATNTISAQNMSIAGKLSSTLADLAEYYLTDQKYEAGTVLAFGGDAEVTISDNTNYQRIAGVVTTKPAYVMNTGIQENGACIALAGRVPVKVTGKINKGDLLRASPDDAGVAIAGGDGGIIGRAIQGYDSVQIGTIEVMVGRT